MAVSTSFTKKYCPSNDNIIDEESSGYVGFLEGIQNSEYK